MKSCVLEIVDKRLPGPPRMFLRCEPSGSLVSVRRYIKISIRWVRKDPSMLALAQHLMGWSWAWHPHPYDPAGAFESDYRMKLVLLKKLKWKLTEVR